MLAHTGLTVEEHQRRTVANFVRLEQLWFQDDDVDLHPEAPFMPTVQGKTVGDYLRCWDMFGEAGVDLSCCPDRVKAALSE